ncbi:MAG: protein kinase [Alphaproteobacteria bacterium]|nr:protein kinase [Alphaproteobacteria bacterium]
MAQDDPHKGSAPPDPFASGVEQPGVGLSAGAWGSAGPAEPVVDELDPFGVTEAQRYARGGVLGEGGMGRVWAARDLRLGRGVALKEAHGDSGLSARLAREASITAQLDHPGIVTVLDAGRGPDGRPFYTMQQVRGHSLGEALAEAPDLPARLRLLRRLLDACEAVAYAHDAGVVHRDLKPENIMLGAFGETRVVDWGLARRLDEAEDGPRGPSPSSPALTRVGEVIGTPAWMSPEQARGEPADARSDVWCLGAILRALLQGPALDPLEQAPPELRAVVARATAPDPDRRYADAGALAQDLAAYVDGRRVDAHDYSPRELLQRFLRAWRLPLLVGAVALLLLAVAIGVGWRRSTLERDRALAAEQLAREAEQSSRGALAQALALQALSAAEDLSRTEAELLAAGALTLQESPDARGVLAAFAGPRPRLIAREPGLGCAEVWFSASGRHFLCEVVDGGYSVWQVEPLRQLWSEEGVVQAAAFSEDDAQLWIVGQDNQRRLVDTRTGAQRLPPRPFAETFAHGVRASQGWLYTTGGDNYWRADDRGEHYPIARLCLGSDMTLEPLPDGRLLAVCMDGRTYEWSPEASPEPAAPVRWGEAVTWPRLMRVTRDGRLAVLAFGGQSAVGVVSLESREMLALLRVDRGDLVDLSLSPDGRLAAVLGRSGGVRVLDLERLSWLDGLPPADVASISFAEDGSLITVGRDLQRWHMPARPSAWQLRTLHGQSGLSFSGDAARLAVATGQGLEVFDAASGELLWRYDTPDAVMKAVDHDPDTDTWLIVGMGFVGARRLSAEGALLEEYLSLHPGTLRRGAVAADGLVLGLPHRGGLVVWEPDGRVVEARIEGELGALNLVSVAPSGRSAVLMRMDGGLLRWRQEQGLERLPSLGVTLTAAAALSDTEAVLAEDHALMRVNLDTMQVLQRIPVEGERTYRVAVSPDQRWLAVGDLSGGVRVWSLEDGSLKARLRGHHHRVSGLDFSPDGRWLASSSWDLTARLWDLSVLERAPEDLRAEIEADWGIALSDVLPSGSASGEGLAQESP